MTGEGMGEGIIRIMGDGIRITSCWSIMKLSWERSYSVKSEKSLQSETTDSVSPTSKAVNPRFKESRLGLLRDCVLGTVKKPADGVNEFEMMILLLLMLLLLLLLLIGDIGSDSKPSCRCCSSFRKCTAEKFRLG